MISSRNRRRFSTSKKPLQTLLPARATLNDHQNNQEPGVLAPKESLSERAQRALQERPNISVRIRIFFGLFLVFVLSVAVILFSLTLIRGIRGKMVFLEAADNLRFEIQGARRFEKNFFLYGTNLNDALEHIQVARTMFEENADNVKDIIGSGSYEAFIDHLIRYEELLHSLMKKLESEGVDFFGKRMVEADLRGHGAELNAIAKRLTDRERSAIDRIFTLYGRTLVIFIAIFFLLMIYLAYFFTHQILHPLTRFVGYTQRIARGDLSPILPARRYKDEFSDLAMSFNRMLDELKNHQEQLLQSRKMAAIGNLTAGIAHELNNPLNNITITIESLQDDLESMQLQSIRKLLKDIEIQTERCSATVKNLLDFTRMEKPSFVPISVPELLNATVRLIKNEMDTQGIDLAMDVPETLPQIQGDFVQLQQVFVNLMLNSIQAMEGGGRLALLGCSVDDGSVRVDVIDTGVGIPASQLSQIFDPFYTTKEVGKGTGLGLTVSYSIIQKHRGRISVKSDVNVGSTFSVFLPRIGTE